MTFRSLVVAASAGAALLGLSLPAAAPAAVEAGDDCVGALYGGTYSMLPEGRAPGSSALPLFAPVAGVATGWRIRSSFGEPTPVRMAVFRNVGPGKFLVTGESAVESAVAGLNTFPTRIAVEPGDRFGEVAVGGNYLACVTNNAEDLTWSSPSAVGLGMIQGFAAGTDVRIPIAAVIEPDADRDGYGDETQDRCPQSAAVQGPCPPLTLGAVAFAGRSAVTVYVTAGIAAQVGVSGTAGVPKPGGGKSNVKLKPVKHLANPGQLTKYKLRFPARLTDALESLPAAKSLKLKLTAGGANAAGVAESERVSVKLKGRGSGG